MTRRTEKRTKEILFIAGARPNFMKVAPVLRALRRYRSIRPFLIHTGQHYDLRLSADIFRDLGLPKPDVNLGVGSGSHAEQTAEVLKEVEKLLLRRKPDLVVVVGDVNSTLAGALAAVKLHIPVAHVEAGLRSGDRSMPEEINRVVTDSVSDLLFTHCREADENLLREGIPREKIHFVGNVMIDSLDRMLPAALRHPPLSEAPYGLITLHRPGNVDDPEKLRGIFEAFGRISKLLPLYFPVHPRTRARLQRFRILPKSESFRLMDPLSYLPFVGALARAKLVLTDSGGIQEETTVLGVPCLTLRKNSERMITVREGTNRIVGDDPERIVQAAFSVLRKPPARHRRPEKWDGRAAERIARMIVRSAPQRSTRRDS